MCLIYYSAGLYGILTPLPIVESLLSCQFAVLAQPHNTTPRPSHAEKTEVKHRPRQSLDSDTDTMYGPASLVISPLGSSTYTS